MQIKRARQNQNVQAGERLRLHHSGQRRGRCVLPRHPDQYPNRGTDRRSRRRVHAGSGPVPAPERCRAVDVKAIEQDRPIELRSVVALLSEIHISGSSRKPQGPAICAWIKPVYPTNTVNGCHPDKQRRSWNVIRPSLFVVMSRNLNLLQDSRIRGIMVST